MIRSEGLGLGLRGEAALEGNPGNEESPSPFSLRRRESRKNEKEKKKEKYGV